MLNNKKIKSATRISLIAMAGICLLSLQTMAEKDIFIEEPISAQIVESTVLLPTAEVPYPEIRKTMTVVVTAYSSTVDQTDNDPFVTASGEWVRDGIVANNGLPFGTQIRMPELYGDKIFVVKDRMHQRKGNYHVDIWFPTRVEAINFGAKTTKIEILGN